jgi:outer membrane protein assembly factor BamB
LSQSIPANVSLLNPLQQCWRSKINPTGSYLFASDNARVFSHYNPRNSLLPSFEQNLEQFNLKDGNRIWISELDGKIVSKLSLTEKEIFLIVKTEENLFLKNISKITGIVNWKAKLEGSPTGDKEVFLHLLADKIIIITQNGNCYALKKVNGEVLWKTQAAAKLTSLPAFEGDTIAFGTADNKLVMISVANGVKIYEFKAKNPITAVTLPTSNQLVFGDKKGNVTAIDLKTNNNLWEIRQGAEISSINLSNIGLLVSSFDNFVYLISPNSGKIIWKKRLPGRVIYKPLILDKYAIVTNSYDSNAVFIDIKNGKTINRLAFEEGNYFTNNVILERKMLIFSNSYGLTAYSLFPGGCKDN